MSLAYGDIVARSVDPTGTSKLRKAFWAAGQLQLRQLRAQLRTVIIDHDLLGWSGTNIGVMAQAPDVRLGAFNHWLTAAANKYLLSEWADSYVERAWHAGLNAASRDVRYGHVLHPSSPHVLQQLLHQELKGITAAIVQQVGREAGRNYSSPHKAWWQLSRVFDKVADARVAALCNSIVVAAYNRAKIAVYRQAGFRRVGVIAEIKPRRLATDAPYIEPRALYRQRLAEHRRTLRSEEIEVGVRTAEDDLVCQACQDYADASPHDLDEAEDDIPLHANCRCTVYPWTGAEDTADFDPDQPRDWRGRWSGGGSEGFVSPNVAEQLTLEQAQKALGSSRQQELAHLSGEIDKALGITSAQSSVIGAWADGAENSLMVEMHGGDPEVERAALAMKGHLANQKQVLMFRHADDGPHAMAQFQVAGSLDAIHAKLLRDGIAFHTLEPHGAGAIVHVFSDDADGLKQVLATAKANGSEVIISRGRGEFLGTQKSEGSDREQRDDARREYERIISESARTRPAVAATWRNYRDRRLSPEPGSSGSEGGGDRGRAGARSPDEAQRRAAQAAAGYARLEGLPDKPIKVGDEYYVPGPLARAKEAAAQYMHDAGLSYDPPKQYLKVDKDRAGRVAAEFDKMAHAPDDPAVRASYEALARETIAQWHAIRDTGLKVEWIKPGQSDPYAATPRLAAMDVIDNNHWWGFPTDLGYGTAGESATHNNPMLALTNEVVDGRRLVVNDVFRIVHDYFGHFKEGVGFRADGEENAWRSHAAMYSDAARGAMTAETRGQNSWVNYGPYGESNRKASAGDTHYAPQKIGLMPAWTQNEGRKDQQHEDAYDPEEARDPYGRCEGEATGEAAKGGPSREAISAGPAEEAVDAFDPDEPRDPQGRWTSGGSSGDINAAVARREFGTATAMKRGRNPSYPYVPVIKHVTEGGKERTEQILAKAFVTREEAVAHAESAIAHRRETLRQQLADPRMRALREQHGLPRELPKVEAGPLAAAAPEVMTQAERERFLKMGEQENLTAEEKQEYIKLSEKYEQWLKQNEEHEKEIRYRDRIKKDAETVSKKLDFDPSKIIYSDDTLNFMLNGEHMVAGGHVERGGDQVFLHMNDLRLSNPQAIQGLIAHEIEHAKFNYFNNAYDKERDAMMKDPGPPPDPNGRYWWQKKGGSDAIMTPDGKLRPPYDTKYPLYTLHEKVAADVSELVKGDGVTNYSVENWQAWKKNQKDTMGAIHETLAEMAMLQHTTGKLPEAKDYYGFRSVDWRVKNSNYFGFEVPPNPLDLPSVTEKEREAGKQAWHDLYHAIDQVWKERHMIEHQQVHGKDATVAYLNDRLEPVDDKANATIFKVIFADGGIYFLTRAREPTADYSPDQPRVPAGSPEGGEWGEGGGPRAVPGSPRNYTVRPDPAQHVRLTANSIKSEAPEHKPRSRSVAEIAKETNARANEIWKGLGVKSGKVEGPSPATDEILSDVMAAEIKDSLTNGHSQPDWYDKTMKEAMRIATAIHPEIATDANAKFAFTTALAITSQGQRVSTNATLTEEAYGVFEKTGRFPTDLEVNKPSINDNFKKVNTLIDRSGGDVAKVEEFFSKRMPAGDLVALMNGRTPGSKGKSKDKFKLGKINVDTPVYGSAILGPKIGEGFYQNLNGNFQPITMDMWFMRTWGRITGTGIGGPAADSERLEKALRAEGRRVPKDKEKLIDIAREIKRENDRGFARKEKTVADKTELDHAAERYVLAKDNGMVDQPAGGTQREWITKVFLRSLEKLKGEGIDITPAGAQATIWNPEKVLFERLGARTPEEADYAQALKLIAEQKNVAI